MTAIDIISRIIHVLTAITLVGGSIFSLLVLIPATNGLDGQAGDWLAKRVTARWKRVVHGGIALLLLSGFYNYFRAIPDHQGDGLYHGLIGVKMLLALAVFFIAAALVGRSAKLQSMRDNRRFWLQLLIFLAVLIVVISGYAKVALSG